MSDFYSNNNSVKIVFPNSEQPKLKDLRYVYEHPFTNKDKTVKDNKMSNSKLNELGQNVIFTYI